MSKKQPTEGKTQEERITELEGRMDEQEREIRKLRATTDKLWKRQQLHDNAVKKARKEQEKKLASEKKKNRKKIDEDAEEVERDTPEKHWEELQKPCTMREYIDKTRSNEAPDSK
ncbi:MAG: hypothetical protein LUD47_03275 [Clostridia bacterium]|nr:hypothetical protein [Clostridia bacterium]